MSPGNCNRKSRATVLFSHLTRSLTKHYYVFAFRAIYCYAEFACANAETIGPLSAMQHHVVLPTNERAALILPLVQEAVYIVTSRH